MKYRVALLTCLMFAGCSETDYLAYQGRPAESALECKAAYEEAKRRGGGVDYSSGASIIGSAIGKGIAAGAIESAYESCLARVSALPASAKPSMTKPVPSGTATSRNGLQCERGASPLQGGTGYCAR